MLALWAMALLTCPHFIVKEMPVQKALLIYSRSQWWQIAEKGFGPWDQLCALTPFLHRIPWFSVTVRQMLGRLHPDQDKYLPVSSAAARACSLTCFLSPGTSINIVCIIHQPWRRLFPSSADTIPTDTAADRQPIITGLAPEQKLQLLMSFLQGPQSPKSLLTSSSVELPPFVSRFPTSFPSPSSQWCIPYNPLPLPSAPTYQAGSLRNN